LARRIGRLTPVENEYGAYNTLSAGIALHRLTTQLIPGVGESVVVELEIAPGRTTTITLDYISPEEYAALPKAVQPQWEAIDESKYMSYSFLDKGRRAMYFRLASIGSREQFLYMKASGMAGMEGYLKDYYARFLKREMPTDIDDAIAAAPSLAATFRAMLTEMKQTEAPYLIIDLRNNGGGTTPIVYSTLYQLWGDRYFETDMGVQFYAMYSPLYAQKYGMTFDEFNAQRGGSIEPGEYSFDDDVPDTRPVVERRNDWLASSFGGDVEGVVADLDGHPVYTPRQVFVITNYATFSAAFHYAFYLWKMGATVVGVPSSQAPNAFMDGTPFELPYTDLKGVISSSAQLFLPSDDPRAKVFWPDIMLSPDDYRRYGFDRHAELLYLMDYLELDK
jgi:hypothetical protein